MGRSQQEIVDRVNEIKEDDVFGFRSEVLIMALDFEHAQPFLNEDVTAEAWDDLRDTDTETNAKKYYQFALQKIDGHRSLSASRSVEKLTEYAWLLGRDDIVTAMDAAGYAQYGAPKIAAFAAGLGLEYPSDQTMVRMANGLPCTTGCDWGCGN